MRSTRLRVMLNGARGSLPGPLWHHAPFFCPQLPNGTSAAGHGARPTRLELYMRRIINGKAYDTSTAKEVGNYSYLYPGEFDYVEETLYLKKTGEFFLYGEGGARSRYAESAGNGFWGSGSRIIPLREDEARAWAEGCLTGEEYEEIFGEVEE